MIDVSLNLPTVERIALQWLKKNKDIIIANADEGNSVVVLNTFIYLELAHAHLNDKEMYQLLQLYWTNQTAEQFWEYWKLVNKKE